VKWTKKEHPAGWIIESDDKAIARFLRELCPEGEIDKLIAAHNSEEAEWRLQLSKHAEEEKCTQTK
jgi:hypothetical protein